MTRATSLRLVRGDARRATTRAGGEERTRRLEWIPRFELSGAEGAPLVIVLGGISADAHVTSTERDARAGWWENIVGAGAALDTNRFRVLGVDYVDGGVDATGRPARVVTTHDQADAIVAVLDSIGARRVHAIVGASYGGMVALAFAERNPDRVERLVVISAAHESHPMSTGIRAMQRRVVELGLETGRARDALVIARGIAMTTYRTANEFAERFDAERDDDSGPAFDVERYLLHCGERFAAVFTPERFLALSLSTDLHYVTPEDLDVPAVFVAAEGDTLVPAEQMRELAARYGFSNRLLTVPTIYGHDAFLTEPARIGAIVADALAADTATLTLQ